MNLNDRLKKIEDALSPSPDYSIPLTDADGNTVYLSELPPGTRIELPAGAIPAPIKDEGGEPQ